VKYLPLFYSATQQPVLLVGGGAVALRKARLLHKANARITVIAPEVSDALSALIDKGAGEVLRRPFHPDDLHHQQLVIAATDNASVNAQISRLCHAQHILVNVVDQPDLCNVIFPAIIDRDPMTIAVGSGGGSPVLTRMLRALLETTIPSGYGRLAAFAATFRQPVKQAVDNPAQRRRFWENVLEGPIGEMVLAGREEQAVAMLHDSLGSPDAVSTGEVYLVGAGPGDPDLLTFKAYRLMQRADIVLYDRLVAPAIVDMCRADAQRVYVGKARSDHAVPQEQINELLLRYALEGKRVLRLKGGDPFIFGRGGEEIELLARRGVPFQVVPGITAASGCACYAGIPLTHRDYAQSVRFVTGHLKDGSCDLNWQELVNPDQTVVFYMGLAGLPTICEQLMAHGRAPDTPIALVEQGTTVRQRVMCGQLDNFVGIIAAEKPRAPTLVIVGEVVKLAGQLAWFGQQQTKDE
jgi:uroporphyrin-III C-methyltransferase/precorrin-2 dehydrogenase/sirohydrochlorin ferrochelatase